MHGMINSTQAQFAPRKREPDTQTNTEAPYPHTMTVGDTTVRLRFSERGDLDTRLANAFTSMLK